MGVASGASGGVPRCARARGAHPSELGESSDELPRRRRHGQGGREDEGVSLVVPLEVDAVDVLHHEEHLAHQRRLVRRAAAAVGARAAAGGTGGGVPSAKGRAGAGCGSGARTRRAPAPAGAAARRRRARAATAPRRAPPPRAAARASARRGAAAAAPAGAARGRTAAAAAAARRARARRPRGPPGPAAAAPLHRLRAAGGAGMCEPRIASRIEERRRPGRSSSAGRLASMSEATSRAMSAEDDIVRGLLRRPRNDGSDGRDGESTPAPLEIANGGASCRLGPCARSAPPGRLRRPPAPLGPCKCDLPWIIASRSVLGVQQDAVRLLICRQLRGGRLRQHSVCAESAAPPSRARWRRRRSRGRRRRRARAATAMTRGAGGGQMRAATP